MKSPPPPPADHLPVRIPRRGGRRHPALAHECRPVRLHLLPPVRQDALARGLRGGGSGVPGSGREAPLGQTAHADRGGRGAALSSGAALGRGAQKGRSDLEVSQWAFARTVRVFALRQAFGHCKTLARPGQSGERSISTTNFTNITNKATDFLREARALPLESPQFVGFVPFVANLSAFGRVRLAKTRSPDCPGLNVLWRTV